MPELNRLPACFCKMSIAVFLVSLSFSLDSYSQKSAAHVYRARDIQVQAARFSLEAPVELSSVELRLSGPATVTAGRLRVFGHEGGLPMPAMMRDIIPPIIFSKQHNGVETVELRLDQALYLDNDQFFLAVDQLSGGVMLLTDIEPTVADCATENGDVYKSQLLLRGETWMTAPFRFGIAANLKQLTVPSVRYVIDSTAFDDVSIGEHNLRAAEYSRSNLCAADVNNDNYLDLLVNGRLYINHAGRQFVGRQNGESSSDRLSFFLDVNQDGYVDIVRVGQTGARIMRSLAGGEFTAEKTIEFGETLHLDCFSLADVDGDGLEDVVLGGDRLLLLKSGGEMGFQSVETIGSADDVISLTCIDYNLDGFPDLSVSCLSGSDELWQNQGDGSFREVHGKVFNTEKVRKGQQSRAVFWADINQDGRPDFLSPGVVPVELMQETERAEATRFWLSAAQRGELRMQRWNADEYIRAEQEHSGGLWADLDNNGLLDCVLAPAQACRFTDAYLQETPGHFKLATHELGLDGFGGLGDVLALDADNDGALEIVALSGDKPILLRNTVRSGDALEVQLHAGRSQAGHGIARATVFSGDTQITRLLIGGRGLGVQDAPRLHFGLGDQSPDSIHVFWPGATGPETFQTVPSTGRIDLYEGGGVNYGDQHGDELAISAYPNPFSGSVTLDLIVPVAGQLNLEVYTARGELVRVLFEDEVSAGRMVQTWAGDDAAGLRLPAGAYVFRARIGSFEAGGQLTLLD